MSDQTAPEKKHQAGPAHRGPGSHTRPHFYHRLLRAFGISFGLLAFSLFVGVAGYHLIAGLNWVDSLLNASMILSGMGPVDALPCDSAKVFASCYALFSGVVFITASGIILSPLMHRVLVRFHVEENGDG